MHYLTVADIRSEFARLLFQKRFTNVNREGQMTNLVGNTTIELVNASFIADEPSIFGIPNLDYIQREEQWYNSMSLSVNDIPNGPPAIWKAVADKNGLINSNYGWCIYSEENGNQYLNVLLELKKNKESRRAEMIYTRPSMWNDYNKDGRSDFMCTEAVQYLVRDGAVHAIVKMRSNDGWAGYRNDFAWQQHVLKKLATELNLPVGNIYWNAGSLHIYAKDYYLVHNFIASRSIHITKEEYIKKFPKSEFIL